MTLEQQLDAAKSALRAQVAVIVRLRDEGQTVEQIFDHLIDYAMQEGMRQALDEVLNRREAVAMPPSNPITCAPGFVQCDGNRPEILGNDDRIELDLGNDVRRIAVSGHVTSWNAVRGWRLVK